MDKTEIIHRLIETGSYYFLSRPRRFGKSLLVDTIEELFSGSQELFEGLWIADQWDWSKTSPVIHINFAELPYKEVGLEESIRRRLADISNQLAVVLSADNIKDGFRELIPDSAVAHALQQNAALHPYQYLIRHTPGMPQSVFHACFAAFRFVYIPTAESGLIQKTAAKHGKVVILIDEYDKTLIDYLDDPEQLDANRSVMKSFYSILKGQDGNIRFLLMTGVSRFSRVSIFSDLNNLEDITIDNNFHNITGITQAELERDFAPEIGELQLANPDILSEIREWYNGYNWRGQTRCTILFPCSIT